MSKKIILDYKRETVELVDFPNNYEDFENFVKENLCMGPDSKISFEYNDKGGNISIITKSNYSQQKLKEVLETDDPKIMVKDDDDASDDEDEKEVNLDTLSFAKSLISNKSKIEEKPLTEEKKDEDSKKNVAPEIKETDNNKPNNNKDKEDKDGDDDDDDDDLFNAKASETIVTKKQDNTVKKEEIKDDEKDKKIKDLEKQLKEKDDELTKKDIQIRKYEDKNKRMEKLFEDILQTMNEKLNEELNKKLENKINKINQYYEEKLKQKKE